MVAIRPHPAAGTTARPVLLQPVLRPGLPPLICRRPPRRLSPKMSNARR
jgi:hypothetical protein